MTDPIADMLTRIRNALAVNKTTVRVPFSKLKQNIAEEIAKAGFIQSVEVVDNETSSFKDLRLVLRDSDQPARISEIKRVSKPGRRYHAAARDIHPVLGGRGISIVSTSQGVMTDFEARKKKIGGEVMCEVY
jgi:small subunit ribosomal protein S8